MIRIALPIFVKPTKGPVVAEEDDRIPTGPNWLSLKPGAAPNFMIRYEKFKLTLSKKRDSIFDVMFDLETNLLGSSRDLLPPKYI